MIGSGEGAGHGRTPDCRRRVEAANVHPFLQDDAGAEKADARRDIGEHLRRALIAHQAHAEIDEGRGAKGDQRIGAQPRVALAILPLRADQGPQQQRHRERHEGVEEFFAVEIEKSRHGPPRSSAAATRLIVMAAEWLQARGDPSKTVRAPQGRRRFHSAAQPMLARQFNRRRPI